MIRKIIMVAALVINLLAEDDTLCREAWHQTESKNYTEAISLFDKCIKNGNLSDASLSQAYRNKGVTYSSAKQYTRAIENFDKAIKIGSATIDFDYVNRGNAWSNLGNVDKAFNDYDKALSLNPQSKHVFHNKGVLYAKLGLIKKAYKSYALAYKLGLRSKPFIKSTQLLTEIESRNASASRIATMSFYFGRVAKECKTHLSKNDKWMYALIKKWTDENKKYVTASKKWLFEYYTLLSEFNKEASLSKQKKDLELIRKTANIMLKETIKGSSSENFIQCKKFEQNIYNSVFNITNKSNIYKESQHLVKVMK